MENNKKVSKFKINILSNLVIKILGAIIPFVLAPFVSRALLPEGLGSFGYAHSIAMYFSIFIAFGFLNYGTKKIAEHRNDTIEKSHIFWNITFVKLILFAFVSIAYFVIINVFDLTKGFDKAVYFALYLSLIGTMLDTTFYFQGSEKMFGFSLVNLFVNLLYTFLVIFLVKTPEQLILYTALKSSIILLTSILSFFLIFKEIRYLPKPSFSFFKKIFLESLLFFIPSLILTITPIIDQTMIGAMSNTTEVGYYEAANKIKTIALVFSTAISSILLSRVAYLKSSNRVEDANKKILSSLSVTMFVLLPLSFGILGISHLFIPLYYGVDFEPSILVMYWLTPSTLFSAVTTLLLFGYFFAFGKTRTATIIILICDSFNLLANIIGIKYFGAVGAAFTSSLANGIMMVLCVVYSKKDIYYRNVIADLAKCLTSSIIMLVVVLVTKKTLVLMGLQNEPAQVVIMVFVGIVAYFVSCLSFSEPNTIHMYLKFSRMFSKNKGEQIK